MADGGEGTMQALVDATNGKIFTKSVTGPLNTSVTAHYGILGRQRNCCHRNGRSSRSAIC